jgi:acyl-coenzyme A synthetase/AMP-(fatty) acid ligase
MILNPAASSSRTEYLLNKSDYSLLITDQGLQERLGQDYPDEKVFWYTSGTTGDSKFYSFTQLQLDIMSKTICNSYQITNNDRYIGIMPLWHGHGQGFYWATKYAKCETQFLPMKDIRNLTEYNPTFITAMPDVLKVIAQFKFDNLRFVRSASTALPIELYQHLEETFNVPVIEAFGMTEALSHCFTNPLAGPQRMGTIGLPDGIEAKIVNDHLLICGPCLFDTGWVDTGDLAEQDKHGYYKIVGRHRDQISVKGKKLNPVSLERQILNAVPGVTECVVFGTNAVKCLYVGNAQDIDINTFLLSLAPYCRANMIKNVDSIPIGPSGKISRTWLNNEYD